MQPSAVVSSRARHHALAAAAICLFTWGQAPPAQAQAAPALETGRWYLMPHYSLLDPAETWRVDERGQGLGLKGGLVLSKPWQLQFGLNHARSERGNDYYKQRLASVDGLYLFGDGSVRPFLLGGAGIQRDTRFLNGQGIVRTSPYLSAGAGLQMMFNRDFGLQVDVRRVHGFLRDSGPLGFERSANNYFNVGLIWAFGAAPAPAPRVAGMTPPPPPPPPAPPPPPPPPERITLQASKLFEFGRSRLVPPQLELDRFAQALRDNPQIGDVVITGHTDRIGSVAGNLRLSRQRADSVKAYLVSQGVAPSRITTRGVGSSEPRVQCSQRARKALIDCLEPNRRVEIQPITVTRPR